MRNEALHYVAAGREMNGYGKEYSNCRKYNNGRAASAYSRQVKHRFARRSARIRRFALAALATLCGILICTLSYRSIRTSASSGFKYYTSVIVESGTTLWKLADDYIDYDYYKDRNSYISEVKSINHLDEEGSITEGQILILPYYSNEYIP